MDGINNIDRLPTVTCSLIYDFLSCFLVHAAVNTVQWEASMNYGIVVIVQEYVHSCVDASTWNCLAMPQIFLS